MFQKKQDTKVDGIIKSILSNSNNTFNEFTVEGESIKTLIANASSQIKVSNLIIQNVQGTKENISTITQLFTNVQSVTFNNFFFNRKEEIDISEYVVAEI